MNLSRTILKAIFTRGVVQAVKQKEIEKLLASGRPMRVKHGIDPTTSRIHLGYATVYRKLRTLQDCGHTVVFLIGDFTARFGDPTGRTYARTLRDRDEVRATAAPYLEQISQILDPKKLEVRYNSEWYERMQLEDFIRILSHFTCAQMLERDMFRARMKEGKEVLLHELMYPVLQGYDSVMVRSDLTVIGSDQIFNEMVGRTLQRAYGQTPQGILALEVLPGTDGARKMSQSYGNTIDLEESADMQYGKLMSIPDSAILQYLKLLTPIPDAELRAIAQAMAKGTMNPKKAKERLAYEIVSWLKGEGAAKQAQEEFQRVFSEHKVPARAPEYAVDRTRTLTLQEALVASGLASSKTEARRLVVQRAVRLDGTILLDPHLRFECRDGQVLQVGRRARIIKTR